MARLDFESERFETSDGKQYVFGGDEDVQILWRNQLGEMTERSPGMCGVWASNLIGVDED